MNNPASLILPEDSGSRFLRYMQEARDKVLIQKIFAVMEVPYGQNIHNRTFEEMQALEKSVEIFLREWRGIGTVAAYATLADIVKAQHSLKAESIDGIFREYFSLLTVA